MLKISVIFGLIGAFVPLVFSAMWKIVSMFPQLDIAVGQWVQWMQLVLWPSSIFMIASTGGKELFSSLMLLSILCNVVLYALIGLVVGYLPGRS